MSSIDLPSSVTKIGGSVFRYCTGLSRIEIPSLVDTIGDNCFANCSNLKEITVAEGNKSYQSQDGILFNKDLTTLCCYPAGKEGAQYTVPSTVTAISIRAFYLNTSLTRIELPSALTSIGDYAFCSCTNLSSIELPSSVSALGVCAFYGCINLSSIKLPDALTTINESAFYGAGLKSLDIPSTVTSIGKRAFYTDSLMEIFCHATVPIPTAGSLTFSNTTYNSATLYVPESSVDAYRASAEYYWNQFQNIQPLPATTEPEPEVTLPATVYDDQGIRYYISKEGVCSVQKGVDSAEVIIPQEITYSGRKFTVTSISREAFEECSNLRNITLSDAITSIGDWAFCSCDKLSSFEFPKSLTTIGEDVFRGCRSLTHIVLPNSVTSIGRGAFFRCRSLSYCELSNALTSIQEQTFFECDNLQTIVLPASITAIGEKAFGYCGLKSIELPRSINTIGNSAFKYCDSLSEIICNAIIPINTEDSATFSTSTYTTATLYVPEASIAAYRTSDYCWSKFQNIEPIKGDTVEIFKLDGVTYIPTSDSTCSITVGSDVIQVIIPQEVTYAGTTYTITAIANGAFYLCTQLTQLELPNTITAIGDSAFYGCDGLISVTLPYSLTAIGDYAFAECSKIVEIYCYATVPATTIEDIYYAIFSNTVYASATLYVPEASIDAYRTSEYCWSKFQNIKPIANGTEEPDDKGNSGETEEPSGNEGGQGETAIDTIEQGASEFMLEGHTLYLSAPAIVRGIDGKLISAGERQVTLAPGCYIIHLSGKSKTVLIQ
jgi:hypothetical protein